jgi:hypothetical protein
MDWLCRIDGTPLYAVQSGFYTGVATNKLED